MKSRFVIPFSIVILSSLLLVSCYGLDFERERHSFFNGKVNGESFETVGELLFCSKFSETVYTDNVTDEVNGFHFEARNCDLGEEIEITVPDNLSIGTFRGCGENPESDLDFSVSYLDEENDHCEDANLEITVIEIKEGSIYIEGYLDAKLYHPGFGDMILSNVHFGIHTEER